MPLPKHLTEQIAKEAKERYPYTKDGILPIENCISQKDVDDRRKSYIAAKTELLESGDVAISFAEWLQGERFIEMNLDTKYWGTYTTKELYTLFIQDYFKP